MLSKITSMTVLGLHTQTVQVEVNSGRGQPGINLVGLPNKAVQESQHRVKTALQNCAVRFPATKLTINLAPADVPKEGPVFDLAIALGIMHVFGEVSLPENYNTALVGELSLDGSVRPIKGCLPFVLHARNQHLPAIIIPAENAAEVATIKNIDIYAISHLSQLFDYYRDGCPLTKLIPQPFSPENTSTHVPNFADVHGQYTAKRALEIAAAGGHNVLLNGSPGSGKSMLAQALVGILPPLTEEETIEVTTIYSVAGLAPDGLITCRPFRNPHHTISQVGLIGGGTRLKPGEISLAHHGILFLDEFPEFSHSCVESLRQPMEDRTVHISRAAGSAHYPANFSLIAAANPCPCGYRFSQKKHCTCTEPFIQRYQHRISGPILDRIDMHVIVREVEVSQLTTKHTQAESSQTIQQRVIAARQRQRHRLKKTAFTHNAELTSQAVKELCTLSPGAEETLRQAVDRMNLSARGFFKIIKVAQTIADLADTKTIDTPQIAEALQYRALPV